MNNGLITNSACPICKTGKMKFDRLIVNRLDFGKGKKFLSFRCNECNHNILKPFMSKHDKQLDFNELLTK